MTRDDVIRAVIAFGPILLLAIGVWVYHLRYLRAIARDEHKQEKRATLR